MAATDATKKIRSKSVDLRLAARRAANALRAEASDPLTAAQRLLGEARSRNDFQDVRHWSLVYKFLSDSNAEFEHPRLSELEDGVTIGRIFMTLSPENRRKVIEFATSIAKKT